MDPRTIVEVVETPTKRKALWLLAGVAAAALLIGVVFLWWRRSRAPADEEGSLPVMDARHEDGGT
jgi:hypothetical protein